MKTTRFDHGKCPACWLELTASTDVLGQKAPKTGDLTVCVGCLTWLIFNNDLTTRRMNQEELDNLPPREVKYLMKITSILTTMKKKDPSIGR